MANKSSGIYNVIDTDGINRSILNVMQSGEDFNTFTTPKGLRELRQEIAKFLDALWHYEVDYQRMLITTGSQQSLNLLTYSLLKEGDTVLIEEPTYYGAIDCFKKKGVKLVGVRLFEEGIDLEDLESKIVEYKPKCIYVSPTFNNPTGYAWSGDCRVRFLEIINKYNVLVIEDDPYSLMNYTENEYKSLYQLNDGKGVVYLGTFSKYISPSINVGYILASADMIDTLYSFKESFDLCTSLFSQMVVLDYLKNNDLQKIIQSKVVIYKMLVKQIMDEIIEKYGDKIESFSDIKGGLFLTAKFKGEVPKEDFSDLSRFYISGTHESEARINICSVD
ncbi:MAG: PLP-dependent aminotransferase family protein [Clostridiales bacterium]|nr:PLP-dependent aminotransferase family protein [Clostridiales bacterium]